MEWKITNIGSLCDRVCSGGTPKSTNNAYYNGNIPWLNTKEVNFNRIYDTEKNITQLGLENSSAKWISENSVIVAMYGATAGKVAITKIPITTNQACCNLSINSEIADYNFVYYFLCSKFYELSSLANGGAQQNLNAQIIKDFPIKIPVNLSDQKKIAGILSALDSKIENNNKINANLEAQAEALFKSWFVDFTPFKDQPFVDSELGPIPQGWKVVSLDDMTSKVGTGLNPRKNFTLGQGSNYYVTIKNMYNNRVYLDSRCDKITDEAIQKIQKRSKLQVGDLLFSGIGTIGRVALINKPPYNWNTSESVFNLHPSEEISSEFLYLLLLSNFFQNYVKINTLGGVQQGIRMASLKSFRMALPDRNVLIAFDRIIQPIVADIKRNDDENDSLVALRDTLLPKLMSGEIKL